MIVIRNMSDEDMKFIMENKDISEEMKEENNNVLAIFTQNWCGDWKALNREIEANLDIAKYDVTIFICIYNTSPLFKEFKHFKESFWHNRFIPYLRYYKKGKLIKETNQMPLIRVLKSFN